MRGLAADPGFSRTGLQAKAVRAIDTPQSRFWDVCVHVMGQSAAMGSLPQLRAATDPSAAGGTLYAPRLVVVGDPVVRRVGGPMADPAEQAALWNLSEELTGLRLASFLG